MSAKIKRRNKYSKSDESRYRRMDRMFPILMTAVIVALPLSLVLCVSVGEANIPFEECVRIILFKMFGIGQPESAGTIMSIVWLVRIPRGLLAAVVGAGLALCGVVMQSSVQNPLADPYILGTSAGASLGATASIMLGLGGIQWASELGVPTCAFIGAMGASTLVLLIAGLGGHMTSVKLVLGGTIINMICSTFSSLITMMFPNKEGMESITFWMMGRLQTDGYSDLTILPALVIIAGIYFFTQSRIMNTMMLGDETAITLGVDTTKKRVVFMAVSSLLVGFMVTKCGIIGYVGLIIPHISRGLVGTNHKRLIPFSFFLGALFLLWADLVARSLKAVLFGSTGELPLGLITAAVGAPLLLDRIIRQGSHTGDSR